MGIDYSGVNVLLNSKQMALEIKVPARVSNSLRKYPYKDKQCLAMIVTNLLACVDRNNPLVYSRRTGDKTLNSKNISVYRVIKAVDFLVENGLVTNVIGVASKVEKYRMPSYIRPTDEFVSSWDTTFDYADAEMRHLDSGSTIELRDANKSPIAYQNTSELITMGDAVRRINGVNARALITDGHDNILTNIYTRIFNENFRRGGRYYRADVLHMKNRDTNARLDITINGDSVVEVDYSNLHFRIAAALCGYNINELPDDAYSGIIDDSDNKTERRIVKLAVNILFNTSSELQALRATQMLINELPTEEKSAFNLGTARTVIERIKHHYPQFVHLFHNEKPFGGTLQYWESLLAGNILEASVGEELPCLPVHDSFITESVAIEWLIESMTLAFNKVLEIDCRVPLVASWKEGGRVVEQRF